MKNTTIINFAREEIKRGLSQCSERQQLNFKRMYASGRLDLPIEEVVDKMDTEKLDWALTQVERTLFKKEIPNG